MQTGRVIAGLSWAALVLFVIWALILGLLLAHYEWVLAHCTDDTCMPEVLGAMLLYAYWAWAGYVLIPAAGIAIFLLIAHTVLRRRSV